MSPRSIFVLALAAGFCGAVRAEAPPDPAVAEIVDKNVAARGGLEAWRNVHTLAWVGHMESAHAPVSSVPFLLLQKRPNMTRFELNTLGQTTLRTFDGIDGWKLQASHGGAASYKPYTPQELKFAQDTEGLDGPLIDYKTKGIKVAFEGVEEVEAHKAYRLRVQLPSGTSHHLWIDADSFLDLKYDRTSYDTTGRPGVVSVFYRDYRSIDGLQIPSTIEIGGGTGQAPDRMLIEKISVNPPLEDRAFRRGGTLHGDVMRNGRGGANGPGRASLGRDPVTPGTMPTLPAPDGGLATE